MDFGFKFQIGQTLEHVTAARHADHFFAKPVKYFVVERSLVNCPGGVQRHYHCRAVTPDGRIWNALVQINEVELREAPSFDEDAEKMDEELARERASRKL